MVEVILVKRAAKAGEMGLFLDNQVFIDEWQSIKIGAEVKAECTVPANLRYLKFFWALIGKVADNSPDNFLDKQDCADRILIEARHYKAIYDNLRDKTEIRAKSIAGLSGDTWIHLLKRVTWVVTDKFLPGMDANGLKAEIEAMIGPDVVASAPHEPAAPKRRRAPAAPKASPEPANEAADPNPVPQQPDPDRKEGQAAGEGGDGTHANPGNAKTAPTNEAEYIAAARNWIAKQSASHTDARAYFEGEHHVEMRQKCGVGIGTRNMLRRELAEKYDQPKGETNAKS